MKLKEKIFILFHTIIISLLLLFFFGKLWLLTINIFPIIYLFIKEENNDV